MQGKKFISPRAWFSMIYPADWNEFEDGEGSFLFYNPEVWTGNFRISAYRGEPDYAEEVIRQEMQENETAVKIRVGSLECAYSKEMIQERGTYYINHIWITGVADVAFECSFTVPRGGDKKPAEDIIASLEVRREGEKYPAEVIPARLSEISEINDAYQWVAATVKEEFKKDFQGMEEDLEKLQQLADSGFIRPKKKEQWLAVGIAFCVILTNEIEGMEWKTLIDGNREAPVLQYGDHLIDPMKIAWSKVKAGEPCNLADEYQKILNL